MGWPGYRIAGNYAELLAMHDAQMLDRYIALAKEAWVNNEADWGIVSHMDFRNKYQHREYDILKVDTIPVIIVDKQGNLADDKFTLIDSIGKLGLKTYKYCAIGLILDLATYPIIAEREKIDAELFKVTIGYNIARKLEIAKPKNEDDPVFTMGTWLKNVSMRYRANALITIYYWN